MAKGTATEVSNGSLCGLYRGVLGHALLENILNFGALRLILVQSEPKLILEH